MLIPGPKHLRCLEENVAAGGVAISREEMDEIAAMLPGGSASGARCPESMMKFVNR